MQASMASAQVAPPTSGEPLPEPSIILGRLDPIEASFGTAPEGIGGVGTALSYDDVETRRAFRESDPELFASLVVSGAFDPPATELIRALQSELQRMNCYTRGVDGRWGSGSAAGAALYWQTRGAPGPTEPTLDLFREIMLEDSVACPIVAAPQRPRPVNTTSARPNTSVNTVQQPRRPEPQPNPQVNTAPSARPSFNLGFGVAR
jgi:hypothetical protein